MAYQAKRSKKVVEDLELTDEQGRVVETLHVRLDADTMVGKIQRKYTDLMRIQMEVTEMQRKNLSQEEAGEALERLGNAVKALFQAVFGEEDAEKIVTFYEDRYIEMCQEVMPFITGVIIPRLREVKQQNRKRILQKYNRGLFGSPFRR